MCHADINNWPPVILDKSDSSTPPSVLIAQGINRTDCIGTDKFVIELTLPTDAKWKCVETCGTTMYPDAYNEKITQPGVSMDTIYHL